MKATPAVLLALLAAGFAEAQTSNTSNANTIKVDVVGLHSNDGEVHCALYSSADGFPDGFAKAPKTTTTRITNEQAVCEFPAVTPGDYAISVFQDENSNGKLDRNFMGTLALQCRFGTTSCRRVVRESELLAPIWANLEPEKASESSRTVPFLKPQSAASTFR